MNLLKAYQYFFYTLFRFYEMSTYSRWWSEWKAYISMLALSIWLYSGLEIYYHYFFNVPMKSEDSGINLSMISFGLITAIINWFLFENKDKWKSIVEKFDKLAIRENRVGGIIVWSIIILIIIFYWFFSLPLLSKVIYQ